MGKVYTTSEDLTSIANAIRAKAGTNNSLVYPTGFVSGIQGIEADTWDGFGANPEFVQTIYTNSITLADTDWKNITISTSNQLIYNEVEVASSSNKIILNNDYDYLIKYLGKINYIYESGTEIAKGALKSYYLCINNIYSYNSTYNKMLLNKLSDKAIRMDTSVVSVYLSANQTYGTTTNTIGINFSLSGIPQYSTSSGIYSMYAPQIKMVASSSYMTTDMINHLDENNTTIDIIIQLYKYKKGSTFQTFASQQIQDQIRQDFASQ